MTDVVTMPTGFQRVTIERTEGRPSVHTARKIDVLYRSPGYVPVEGVGSPTISVPSEPVTQLRVVLPP